MSVPFTLLMISGLIAALLAAIVNRKRIFPMLLPFGIYLFVGVANELLSLYLIAHGKTTVINNNVFMLLECLLLTWQFKNWSYTINERYWNIIMVIFGLLFVIEIWKSSIKIPSFYFNIVYCFFLVLCATHRLAERALSANFVKYLDNRFLICAGLLLYFFCRVLLELCLYYGMMQSAEFRRDIQLLMVYINLFVNLLYFFAIVWTSRKPEFITV